MSPQRLLDLLQQDVGLKRFGNIVSGTRLHGEDGVLYLGIARHHDERNPQVVLLRPFEHGEAVVVWQAEIGEDQVAISVLLQQEQRALDRGGFLHFESLFSQPCLNQGAKRQVILHNQYLCHIFRSLAYL